MIVLSGGDLVLPDGILSDASLLIEGGRIAAVEQTTHLDVAGAAVVDVRDCFVVPGFIDVHVHGIEGFDTLDEGDPIAAIAARLPRYGVTAFCPTTVACGPHPLRTVLAAVARLRAARPPSSARVLPAHLESNFINPEYRGAQPAECLRSPGTIAFDSAQGYAPRPDAAQQVGRPGDGQQTGQHDAGDFSARDILDVIAAARPDVGIVTVAPELPGGLDLVRMLATAGHRVALGHSAAGFEEGVAAIEAGARHATHLFNRMAPMTHRTPGLAGAVLSRDDIAAELICDGHHVHPAMCRVAIAAKRHDRIMAITDGTAGSGLPPGAEARLGGRRIRVTDRAATLDDGTLAGSTLTMDRAFRNIVTRFGFSIVDAAVMCATTPAREMGMTGYGVLARDAIADLVVLDRGFRVVRTLIEGREVHRA